MPEFIEREALSEYFREKFEYYKAESEIKVCGGYMYDEKMQYAAIVAKHFLDELKRTPTADVVEVVRCKDCAHAVEHKYSPVFFKCDGCSFLKGRLVSSNFYCKCGERRRKNDTTGSN